MKFRARKKKEFDKYLYYSQSVQSPEADIELFKKIYEEIRKKNAKVFREDFCGTFLNCCEWVKSGKDLQAIGVDVSEEPLEYGKRNHLSQLSDDQKSRLNLFQKSVLEPPLPSADVAIAVNASYFIFKERSQLKKYFSLARESLNQDGLFILDMFGGALCLEPNEEKVKHDGFTYFWDQDSFNPVTNEASFYIHFKRPGEKRRDKVFSYFWRMWGLPEVMDILKEAGFSKTHVYWETEDQDYILVYDEPEPMDVWLAYLVSEK